MSGKRLLVVVSDRLTDLISKGEITTRYYNPGEVFDEVHILMTNDDRPDLDAVRTMVGRAVLHLHNLPAGAGLFATTLGWQPWLLGRWAGRGVELARAIGPNLIRTYGNSLNGFLGARIAMDLQVPLVVSLHTDPDELRDRASVRRDWLEWLTYNRLVALEIATLRAADWVLPVYQPIGEYAARRGAARVEVCYNVINPDHLRRKECYALHVPARVASVGRQIPGKNPGNLIRALASLPDAELTLIGDGPLHDGLRRLAADCGVTDRVVFHPRLSNDEICRLLPDFDLFATHCEFLGIPKAVLEPLLTGLPVVINRRRGSPVPEFEGDWIRLVDDTPEAYRQALHDLLSDDVEREALGRRAYAHAAERWAPERTEQRLADVHRQALAVRSGTVDR